MVQFWLTGVNNYLKMLSDVYELWHLYCFCFLLSLQAEWCHNDGKENSNDSLFVHISLVLFE